MIKKNIFKWHRTISLIALVPVLMWALSGIMHPFMANWLKPKQARTVLMPSPVQPHAIGLPLDSALCLNHIGQLNNFRLVALRDSFYYQVKLPNEAELVYINTLSGTKLPHGDMQYAQWLARQFLGDSIAPIVATNLQTQYDEEYKSVNRLLPVYKVKFDRPDGVRVYVETASSRLGTVMTNARAAFISIFANLHSWEFAHTSDAVRISLIILFVLVAAASAASGITLYGFMWKYVRQQKGKPSPARRWHRGLGITVSLAMLSFALSGAVHIAAKYTPDNREKFNNTTVFKAKELRFDLPALLPQADTLALYNLSAIRMRDTSYLQVYYQSKSNPKLTQVAYMNLANGEWLPDGDSRYAVYLANKFSGIAPELINETAYIDKFGGEYGFVNKRLPVHKVQYAGGDKHRFYVETSTGRLALQTNESEALAGFVFAYFHKFHFLEFAGKNTRDVITVIFALGIVSVSLLGLVLFVRKRAAKRNHESKLVG